MRKNLQCQQPQHRRDRRPIFLEIHALIIAVQGTANRVLSATILDVLIFLKKKDELSTTPIVAAAATAEVFAW